MEGDSFVPYVLRLEFEVMRLATKPFLPGKQEVRALRSSQTEGAEALFLGQ
jgi:hypothetical protein